MLILSIAFSREAAAGTEIGTALPYPEKHRGGGAAALHSIQHSMATALGEEEVIWAG